MFCSIREICRSGWQTSFIQKKYLCRLFLGWQAYRKYLANQQSINNEHNHYTESNLLIDNVPLSAYTNNYLIKLVIPLNKTGLLPIPANFPIVLILYF